jgi:hypothetical protein
MALFKPMMGNRTSLDSQPKQAGYAWFCVDDGTFHIDYKDAEGNLQRKQIQSVSAKSTTVTMLAENWTGNTQPYSQVVTVNGATANSKIDLHPNAVQIVELQDSEITLMLQNDSGVITAWAIGNKPTEDYTMQVLIQEVTPV